VEDTRALRGEKRYFLQVEVTLERDAAEVPSYAAGVPSYAAKRLSTFFRERAAGIVSNA
jgi:hypothetical protein